jgi:hypothetical protein
MPYFIDYTKKRYKVPTLAIWITYKRQYKWRYFRPNKKGVMKEILPHRVHPDFLIYTKG